MKERKSARRFVEHHRKYWNIELSEGAILEIREAEWYTVMYVKILFGGNTA